jgi:hypothetical protein
MGLANMDVRLGNGGPCLSDALSLVRLVKIWRQTLRLAPHLFRGLTLRHLDSSLLQLSLKRGKFTE